MVHAQAAHMVNIYQLSNKDANNAVIFSQLSMLYKKKCIVILA